ncbi:MAG TPA: AI-2E family transporter, partial [Chitinophagaceae bacterium]
KLEKRGMKRGWACAVVFGIIVLFVTGLAILVVPMVSEQLRALIQSLPAHIDSLSRQATEWFSSMPGIGADIKKTGVDLTQSLPSAPQALMKIGNYSLSAATAIFVFIIFASMVVYTVVNPKPLLELYFSLFKKEQRQTALEAFQHTSVMLVGWFKANLIGGGIEAVCNTVFLSIMKVPGAWVWGVLTLFAELVPKIGFYMMAIPPTLVALSVSPMTGLWVAIYFLALNEVMGDFVMPRLRASSMTLHPVSTLFMVLAMASAFGFIGALLATPVAAIIKAFYYAFYKPDVKDVQKYVDAGLNS